MAIVINADGGFRQFALDRASERSADIDKDNADEYAEKFDLEEEYEEAVEEDFHIRKGALSDFITMLQEKEEEAVLDDFMQNYTTADEIINDLGPNYNGMDLDDLERAYLIVPDYDEVADALEDDGYVFIKEDFKTFVFNPNMARGGRTKRMKKGGKIDYESRTQKDFDLEKSFTMSKRTIMERIIGMSSHPLEVRLDTDGMQPTSFLRKLGEKG